MPVGATVAVAGAGLASGAMSASASKKAANTVAQSTDRAAELENQRFQQLLALNMPAYQRGEQAAGLYMTALGIPQATPASTAQPSYSTGQPGASVSYGGGQMTTRSPLFQWFADELGVDDTSYTQAPTVASTPTTPAAQPSMTQAGVYDMVRNTPGYQAQLDQGIKSIDRAAPLVGGMYSGRRLKALSEFNQNTFGSYYQDWLNRVGGVAGQGQTAGQNIGQAGMTSAANAGGLMVQGANARAQGQINSANSWNGALGTGASALGFFGGQAGWFK